MQFKLSETDDFTRADSYGHTIHPRTGELTIEAGPVQIKLTTVQAVSLWHEMRKSLPDSLLFTQ